MRRVLLILAKATTSILLFYLSLRWSNIDAFGERMSRIELGWLAPTLFLLAGQIVLLAARWQNIAGVCGAKLDLASALQITFAATFFNQVLPSTVGGDSARIWLFARNGAGWANATYSVLIDRIVGVFVLALLVIACLPWTYSLIHDSIPRVALLIIGFGAIASTFVLVLFGVRFRQWLGQWTVTRHLSAASRIIVALSTSHRSAVVVFALSATIHLMTVAAAWCCVKAAAAPITFAQVLFLLPPVLLISTVPISIAGWGVRETSMIFAFGYAGLAQSDGLTLSILFGAASFFVGAASGIIWIVSNIRYKPLNEVRS